ncbi:hypothetical protein HK405_003423, partial [Cladochytrium tenue]
MTGLQHVGDPSPVDVIVNPSSFELVPLSDAIYPPRGTAQAGKFPPRIPASWEDEDDYMRNERPDAVLPGAAVARLASPGLHIPPGVEWAPLTMESGTRLDLIRQGYIADLLSAALGQNASQEGGPLASAFTLRQQSKPVIAIPGVGRWTIPIWSYYYLNFTALPSTNSTGSGFNASAFNVTVESQVLEYDTVTLPTGEDVTVYVANVSLSFTNPFDGATQDANGTLLPKVTLDDLGLGITFSIFHEGVRMARATVELPAVLVGRNVGTLAVHGRSDPYGTETLMEWFGKYADGEDTLIVLDEFAISYRGGRARLGWVERMVSRWRFGVVVPGAEEEEDVTGRSFSAPRAGVVESEVAVSRRPLRSLLGSVVGAATADARWHGGHDTYNRPDAQLPGVAASVTSSTEPLPPPRDDAARALKSRPKAAITDYFARSTAHQPAATARNAPHPRSRHAGMSYSRVGAEDAALHARHHAAVVNGVEFPRKQVLDVVERELGAVPLPEEALDECQVFVYVSSKAVRGCVVAEPLRGPDGRQRVDVLRFVQEEGATAASEDGWVGGDYDGDDVNEETGPVCGISRVWVSRAFRRRGIAARLLDVV